jgi:hypothetical protein
MVIQLTSLVLMNETEDLRRDLQRRRGQLLEQIANCADSIKQIDEQLKVKT